MKIRRLDVWPRSSCTSAKHSRFRGSYAIRTHCAPLLLPIRWVIADITLDSFRRVQICKSGSSGRRSTGIAAAESRAGLLIGGRFQTAAATVPIEWDIRDHYLIRPMKPKNSPEKPEVCRGETMRPRCQNASSIILIAVVCALPFLFRSLPVRAQSPGATSLGPIAAAQPLSFDRGAAALWQSLQKLHTRASLLMVTAHPDDEDGGMLTYESRGQGTRVALLTLNRGEGGANVMSSDYFDALGLVRTMELLAAGRYYGVDQYFTRVIDYGFSKTMAESIQHWTRDRVLSDVVRVVRTVRPLAIASVFVGGPSDGHGNHQTAGAMAREVFKAAGDPNVFPDQIRAGLRPWSPVKDYARAPFAGRYGGDRLAVNVEVPEGDFDPVLGASYVQVSREGLGFQKSQNGGPNLPKAA